MQNINNWMLRVKKNLMSKELDIDQICSYARDLYEAKYQFLMNMKV